MQTAFTNISERMSCSVKSFTEFQCGTVIGCSPCNNHSETLCPSQTVFILKLLKTGLQSRQNMFCEHVLCTRSVNTSDGGDCVWWMPGECYQPDCTVATVKFGGGGMMLQGVFWGLDLKPLCSSEGGHLNVSAYQDMLGNCILPILRKAQ